MERPKLLIAASGTGGHLFPAIAVAQALPDYCIEWLGVPERLETQLVPKEYPLHTVSIAGIQKGLSLQTLQLVSKLATATWQTRKLLQQGGFQGVFTTGGYIAAPAILAARSLGLPAILHESNALPGKVTRFLSGWCSVVALGFAAAAKYLPRAKTDWVGTPARAAFTQVPAPALPELNIPPEVPVIVVMGGSQGAVALNQLVRQAAPTWLEAGAWIVHLTGQKDAGQNPQGQPDAELLEPLLNHPHYLPLAFFDNMAGLLHRASLCISRSGAGSLTELALTGTPSLLIPFPFAAEDHQTINARVFVEAGAAKLFPQPSLSATTLAAEGLGLLQSPEALSTMATAAQKLAVPDSSQRLAKLLRQYFDTAPL